MYLQLDTRFNPFTYDEMVKPLLYYKQAYDEVEAAYSDLVTQTESFKDMVNRDNSPEAYEMYQRFSGDLNKVVDDFSKGMTARNRGALLGMKRRYAQDIMPIAKASEAMKEANDLRVKASPDAIFEVNQYNSLDSFLHGQSANNRYQSRDALTKRTAAITEAVMAQALKDPEFRNTMGNQFWMITQHTGGSYEELMDAMKQGMMDNPIAQNRFSEIRQSVARQAGIENYDAQGQQAIMDAIDTGLYAGLDRPVRNFQANPNFKSNASKDNRGGHSGSGSGGGSSKGGSSSSSTERSNRLEHIVKVRATNKGSGSGDYSVGASWQLESIPEGAIIKSYGGLTPEQKSVVDSTIGTDTREGYNYYIVSDDANGIGTGDDDLVVIVPKKIVINGAEEVDYNAH